VAESTLNFQDGAARTIDWNVSDVPGVRYNVQPVQVSLGAELQGADLAGGLPLAPGAFVTLAYLVADWDTDAMANLAANAQRLTVRTAGLYAWHGGGYFSATALGGALIALMQLNGAGLSQSGDNCPVATNLGGNNFWTCSCLIRPHVGDRLTMLVENRTPGVVFLQAWRMAAQRLAP
jgi:hypothetical protein